MSHVIATRRLGEYDNSVRTLKATKESLSEETTQRFFYTLSKPMNVEIHGPFNERAIFPRNEHKLKAKCSGKYVDLSGAQNLNIIGTFVVYGLFEHQLW
jgi:hypothetical protein